MSREKAVHEAKRWVLTAQGDLETARLLSAHARFAHACFHAQQGAEKAVKAVWYAAEVSPWGHSLRKLIEELQGVDARAFEALSSLITQGRYLDRLYIPTRYPNGLPDITPDMAYEQEDAQQALQAAEAICQQVATYLQLDMNG